MNLLSKNAQALMRNATDAMKESRVTDILNMVRHLFYLLKVSGHLTLYNRARAVILTFFFSFTHLLSLELTFL